MKADAKKFCRGNVSVFNSAAAKHVTEESAYLEASVDCLQSLIWVYDNLLYMLA